MKGTKLRSTTTITTTSVMIVHLYILQNFYILGNVAEFGSGW